MDGGAHVTTITTVANDFLKTTHESSQFVTCTTRFSICSSVPRTAVRGHRSELCVVADTAVVLAPAHCQPNFNFHQCGCSHGQRYRYRYKQHSLCGRPFTLLPPLMHFMLRYNAASLRLDTWLCMMSSTWCSASSGFPLRLIIFRTSVIISLWVYGGSLYFKWGGLPPL